MHLNFFRWWVHFIVFAFKDLKEIILLITHLNFINKIILQYLHKQHQLFSVTYCLIIVSSTHFVLSAVQPLKIQHSYGHHFLSVLHHNRRKVTFSTLKSCNQMVRCSQTSKSSSCHRQNHASNGLAYYCGMEQINSRYQHSNS